MIRKRAMFESYEQPVKAYDVSKFLKRKGLEVSTAPYPSEAGIKNGDCFVALKPNGEFIIFHDIEFDDGEKGVLVILASWDSYNAKVTDIISLEEIDKEMSKIL